MTFHGATKPFHLLIITNIFNMLIVNFTSFSSFLVLLTKALIQKTSCSTEKENISLFNNMKNGAKSV